MNPKSEYRIGINSERAMGRRSIVAGPAHLILFSVVWFVSSMRLDHPRQMRGLVWSLGLVCFIRMYLTLNQAAFYSKRRKLWNRLFNITSLWAALNWGVIGTLMVNIYGLVPATLVSLLTVCGISAGGSATLYYRRWLAQTYVVVAVLPGAVSELLLRTSESYGMAFVSVTYLSFLLFQISQSHENYTNSQVNQEKAIDQKNKLQAALQGSLDSVLFLTAVRNSNRMVTDFTVVEVNKKTEEKTSRARSDLIGISLLEVFPSCKDNGLFAKYVQVLETRAPIDEEISVVGSKQNVVWIQHQIIPLGDGVVITTRDISEKTKALRILKEQQDQLTMILNASKVGTWEWDPNTKKILCSDSLLAIYEFEIKPAHREVFLNTIHTAQRDSIESEIKEALKTGKSYAVEFQILGKGAHKWIHEIGHPVCDENGKVLRVTGLSKDITQRKDAEHLIEEQKLKISAASKMAALGEMAGGIAHEINNPLASILSISQLIEKLASQNKLDFPMTQSFTSQIGEIVNRVAETVQGLRNFSRDADDDAIETISTRKILDDTFRFCKAKFERSNVSLLVEAEREIKFECRKTQICQALLSLLNNSFDAIEKEKDKWIKVSIIDNTSFVHIAVVDSGPGVPEKIRDQIMMPFFTTKEVGKGTGLGLSVSKGIIETHGGELLLDSAHPHTRFVIKLPKKQSTEKLVA